MNNSNYINNVKFKFLNLSFFHQNHFFVILPPQILCLSVIIFGIDLLIFF